MWQPLSTSLSLTLALQRNAIWYILSLQLGPIYPDLQNLLLQVYFLSLFFIFLIYFNFSDE